MQNNVLSTEQCINKGMRKVKTNAVALLIKKYSIDIDLFPELKHNWRSGGAHHNLRAWCESIEKLKCKSAHNTDSPDTSTY